MSQTKEQNDFKRGVSELVARAGFDSNHPAAVPYAGAESIAIHEHATRECFLDDLVELLGWKIGAGGDVVGEARLKAQSTTFMDYVGVASQTRAPLLVIEAKAWDKPFVTARTGAGRSRPVDLIARAIQHIKAGGAKGASPVVGGWHEHLEQIFGYVRDLFVQHEHKVPRVALTSGKWMLVFVSPFATFLESREPSEEQFEIFQVDAFVARSDEILKLLGQASLCHELPPVVRPGQLQDHLVGGSLKSSSHGVWIRYEKTGSSRFQVQPRVLVYPVVLLERREGGVVTVGGSDAIVLDGVAEKMLDHFEATSASAADLVSRCESALGVSLSVSKVSDCAGFGRSTAAGSTKEIDIQLVHGFAETPDEWVFATGASSHLITESREFQACPFHEWQHSRAAGRAGQAALSAASTSHPRSMFVDGSEFHCSHQDVLDRRNARCKIDAFEERLCCRRCAFETVCWSEEELLTLPCQGS